MKKLRVHLIFILSLISHLGFSQDVESARMVMNTLCAPDMHGRGYVLHGDSLAANYIAGKFDDEHLLMFNNSYFQDFNFNVNTFPGEMQMKIDGVDLTQGYHFLADASSKGIKGTFDLVWADSATFYNKGKFWGLIHHLRKKVIAFDISTFKSEESKKRLNQFISKNKFHAKAIIIVTHAKLTWDAEQKQFKYAQFIVKSDKINKQSKKITLNVDAEYVKNYHARNVIGYIRGSDYPDRYIIISAHYDHLGMLGKYIYFPGANDNASGVAMLLDFARRYRFHPPKYTIIFIAFAGEEVGLVGSKYYVEHPIVTLAKTRFVLNLDLVGTGKNGITVVNGTVFPVEMSILLDKNNFGHYNINIEQRGKAYNSDHYWFSEKGVHSFFIYQRGDYTYYHDIFDKPDELQLEGYNQTFYLLRDFLREFMDKHL